MRYAKGSIKLSSAQDYPLLRQVMRSQFVTHDQLCEFMTLGCYEIKRQSFNWRVRRLVMHGFLLRHYLPALARPARFGGVKNRPVFLSSSLLRMKKRPG